MKITKIKTHIVPIQLSSTFKTALREVSHVNVVRVYIHFDNGIVGIGEAAPTHVITGDTEASITSAINDIFGPFLIGRELHEELTILDEMKSLLVHNSSPKAAIDIALHDALAKASSKPLYEFLGGGSPRLETDYTISIGTPEKMVQDAKTKVAEGFKSLKIKLGLDPVEIEVAKIRRMNEALGGKIPFRIDANQGWTPDVAIQILNEWSDIPIDFIEQPVKSWDFAGMAKVTANTNIPIMADESLFGIHDAKRLLDEKCCNLLNIKLMKSAGIKEARAIHDLASEYKVDCMIGTMIEGYASLSAAAHFAASAKQVKFYDLDVPFMWNLQGKNLADIGLEIGRGELLLTEEDGIGISAY
ncbi:dipeptide epimerase [Listeria seeligeri]|uniref:dipeptide epimerase n=1 Tax=Listeria seeligeri TaxID=1640 RepID=UPI0010DB5F8C|nr:dipeptide epimerase [Listeria seeligeri]MBC1583111.1 dipeptide epimerase [Listeria seeligeri]MBC1809122.1 dipeptide epimerase [Listeria seeligeri]MBC1866964.1 dipeptide epimerase [Listeria seeligeri]MBC1994904.1 dipeptide epimerase [Listeria seeligeri]MBC2203441.1 dipeptide epimerase [Listeria seeligeri]